MTEAVIKAISCGVTLAAAPYALLVEGARLGAWLLLDTLARAAAGRCGR